jgi:hypothetical protein
MELPKIPRTEEGDVDWPVVGDNTLVAAKFAGGKALDVTVFCAKKLDELGRATAEKLIVPLSSWVTRNAALLSLKGVDFVRSRALENAEPFEGGKFDTTIRDGWKDVEEACENLSPAAKVYAYRTVYAAVVALAIFASWPDANSRGEFIPNEPGVSGPADPGDNDSGPRALPSTDLDASIENVNNLTLVSVFQPEAYNDELEGGKIGFYETLNHYLTQMKDSDATTTDINSFKIYVIDSRGRIQEKGVRMSSGIIYVGGERVSVRQRGGRWQFHRSFLDNALAYRVGEDGVTNYGFSPQHSEAGLREAISSVVEDDDVTVLHFRGHTGYGSNLNLSSVVDPAVVVLGGCNSSSYMRTAQGIHPEADIISNTRGTDWNANDYRARVLMQAFKTLSEQNGGDVTWRQLLHYLRTDPSTRSRNFEPGRMFLPGDAAI